VQRRLKVDVREDWLNQHVQSGRFNCIGHTESAKLKIKKAMLGRVCGEQQKKRMSEKATIEWQRRRAIGWRRPKEATEKALQWRKDNYHIAYSPARNAKMAASKRGTKRHYLPDGSFVMIKKLQAE